MASDLRTKFWTSLTATIAALSFTVGCDRTGISGGAGGSDDQKTDEGLSLTDPVAGSQYSTSCPSGTIRTSVNGVIVDRYLVAQSEYTSFCSNHPQGTFVTLKFPAAEPMTPEFCTPAKCPGTSAVPSTDMLCTLDTSTSTGSETKPQISSDTCDDTDQTAAPLPYDLTKNYCGPEIGVALEGTMDKIARMFENMRLDKRQAMCASLNNFVNVFDMYPANEKCRRASPCDRCNLVYGKRQEWGMVNYMLMGQIMRRCGWSLKAGHMAVTAWKTCKGQSHLLKRPELMFWLDAGFYYGDPERSPLSRAVIPSSATTAAFDNKCSICPIPSNYTELGSPLFEQYMKTKTDSPGTTPTP